MISKKILPPTYLLLAILLMTALHFLLPLAGMISGGWRLAGFLPLGVGIGLNIIADRAFQEAETTVKPFEASTTLITSGVFRISRHPMYLGFGLILVGVALLWGTLSPWLVIPVFGLLMNKIFIQAEEKMLEEQFGEIWLAYQARVRRWL